MYLKTKLIWFLKFKNVLFLLAGLFFTIMSVWDIVSLAVYYWGDWDTVINARSTPESVFWFFVGCAMLICMRLSSISIKKAHFYSSYFETALYSCISYDELSEVTGYSSGKVKFDLHILRILYMKRFSFVNDDSNGGHIELYSKTVQCSCKNCGAIIDKKIYFAGICPYCKTSDVFATVITDNSVYSISNDVSKDKNKQMYYLQKGFLFKLIMRIILVALECTAVFIMLCVTIDYIGKYNDHDYLLGLVLSGEGYGSIELNQKQIMNFILFDIFGGIMFGLIAAVGLRKSILMSKSSNFAYTFSHSKTPFLNFSSLQTKKPALFLRKTIQAGYIKNCTIENHDGKMKIALAKKIVKDSCPSCGAPVTGAVSENYVCKFCKNKILKVIEKNDAAIS